MVRVLAVGSPNWDTMAQVPESFLAAHALPRGDATAFGDVEASGRKDAEAIGFSGP